MVVPAVITVNLQRGKFPRPYWKLLGMPVGSGCVALCGAARSHCRSCLRVGALAISVFSWCSFYFCLYAVPPAFVRRIGHAVVVGDVCMRSVSLCLPMSACSQSDKGLQSPQTHFWGSSYSLHRHQNASPCRWVVLVFSVKGSLSRCCGERASYGLPMDFPFCLPSVVHRPSPWL